LEEKIYALQLISISLNNLKPLTYIDYNMANSYPFQHWLLLSQIYLFLNYNIIVRREGQQVLTLLNSWFNSETQLNDHKGDIPWCFHGNHIFIQTPTAVKRLLDTSFWNYSTCSTEKEQGTRAERDNTVCPLCWSRVIPGDHHQLAHNSTRPFPWGWCCGQYASCVASSRCQYMGQVIQEVQPAATHRALAPHHPVPLTQHPPREGLKINKY